MKYLNTLLLALIISSLATMPAFAKRFGGDGCSEQYGKEGMRFAVMATALDLTAQQEADIQEIISENRDRTLALRDKARASREALKEVFNQDEINETRLQELTHEQASLRAEMMLAKHATRKQIDQVLSPEQQKKHEELRQLRMDRRQTKRHHKGWSM